MTWLMLFALLIVILVAVAVLPRHRTAQADPEGRRQFPWFWVTFPLTMFALVMSAAILLRISDPVAYGWTMYAPLSDESHQPALPYSGLAWLVAGVVGAVVSVFAWRRGRV